MNLIVTCQDVGGSEHLSALLNFFKDHYNEMNCLILAKNPALKILQQSGFNSIEICQPEEILQHINNFQPQFILVSLSSTYDLDCIALEIAKEKKIPSGCIQDFWGSIGFFNKKNLPKYFFVENSYAESLTLSNIGDDCKVEKVGLTKIYNFHSPKKIESKKKIVAVIGQPSNIPGVVETTSEIFQTLEDQLTDDFDIIYKPHPADLEFYDDKKLKIPYDSKRIIFNGSLNDLFFSAVLVINMFSSVLIDFLRYRKLFSSNVNIISCIWNIELRDYIADSDVKVAKLADRTFEDKESFQKFISNNRNTIKLGYNHHHSMDEQNNFDPFRSITKIILENKT